MIEHMPSKIYFMQRLYFKLCIPILSSQASWASRIDYSDDAVICNCRWAKKYNIESLVKECEWVLLSVDYNWELVTAVLPLTQAMDWSERMKGANVRLHSCLSEVRITPNLISLPFSNQPSCGRQ